MRNQTWRITTQKAGEQPVAVAGVSHRDARRQLYLALYGIAPRDSGDLAEQRGEGAAL
jgi:hypothetical protein